MKNDSSLNPASVLLLMLKMILGIGFLWLAFLALAGWLQKNDEEQMQFATKATARAILLFMVLIALLFAFDGDVPEPLNTIIFAYPLLLIGFMLLVVFGKMIEKIVRG